MRTITTFEAAEWRSPIENRLLSALPREECERLLPNLQLVTFSLGHVIYESGAELEWIYFPNTSIISLIYTMEDGSTAEMGLAGNDGVVGVALFLGGDTAPNQAIVQVAGNALRMKAKVLREEFSRGGALQRRLLLYTQAMVTQISQTAACNRLHSVEKRLARLLLLVHDRLQFDDLPLTQEGLSLMLGVRRESVNVAARRLQGTGLIRYNRGSIRIFSRAGLEAVTCECYRVVRLEFDRLLGAGAKA